MCCNVRVQIIEPEAVLNSLQTRCLENECAEVVLNNWDAVSEIVF